mmetsp:Transcript_56275/g.156774  ORF Transcript_56275/g.156774 Transcript_56275/m.156774 type:complete len:570 (-) Transcript_56275:165-1874(-)
MDPRARDFLRQACGVIQEYDQEGRALFPASAWDDVLGDLGLSADSDAAGFLASQLQRADDGMVTYMPLLEALGVVPNDQAGAGGGGDGSFEARAAASQPYHATNLPPPQTNPDFHSDSASPMPYHAAAMPPQYGNPESNDELEPPTAWRPGSTEDPRRGSYDQESQASLPHGHAAATLRPPLQAAQDEAELSSAHGYLGPCSGEHVDNDNGCELDPGMMESWEDFWARRAGTIQRLFRLWDCNQLTNNAFTDQLQELLGQRVDISSPDSEFGKLANKHRSARNMKFAELTTALRHDARATKARVLGQPMSATASYAGSVYGGSVYGGSVYGGSVYEAAPSEVGSEAPSHAAGRPTRALPPCSLGSAGRRHFGSNSQLHGGVAPMPSDYAPSEMYSARSGFPGIDENRPASYGGPNVASPTASQQQRARAPPPYACGDPADGVGGYAWRDSDGYAGSEAGQSVASMPSRSAPGCGCLPGQAGPDPDFRSMAEPRRREDFDRQDAMSESDVASVADSQRDAFTHRNRGGHGNILTWGDDSRTITPERRRGGRAMDGGPRSHISSGVFPTAS